MHSLTYYLTSRGRTTDPAMDTYIIYDSQVITYRNQSSGGSFFRLYISFNFIPREIRNIIAISRSYSYIAISLDGHTFLNNTQFNRIVHDHTSIVRRTCFSRERHDKSRSWLRYNLHAEPKSNSKR